MGITKNEYVDHLIIDEIAKKVANEPMEDGFIDEEDVKNIPQHVIDEELADAARQRTRDLRQMEMYDDEWMNWSGLR
ncbi:MAG: hypothetical protein QGH83_16175 [Candidatus Pacebacteria bacterium]|jgi:hypothetical protein|nr:hypothetical protein [Candidatus Paceibacterota bacterium]|tara:strand:- start:144 stop:374 length:231 start_codon:yes stop_codon:yes gene_type:complete